MLLAIEEAKKGLGNTFPNPIVGCVIVQDKKIIGRGHHPKAGANHAERMALKNLLSKPSKELENATLYVTLTPCCHHGKTPPCTDIIVESNIKKVVIGDEDPNPLVRNKAIQILKSAGIEVIENVLKKECLGLNRPFHKNILTNETYISLKWAQTVDGLIADQNGKSKWITGPKAREMVHLQRLSSDGILVGRKTILTDNPKLDCRSGNGEQIRKNKVIVLSNTLLPPGEYAFIQANGIFNCYFLVTDEVEKKLKNYWLDKGAKFIDFTHESFPLGNKENLPKILFRFGFHHVFAEGGSGVYSFLLEEKSFDRIWCYLAPKLLGTGFSHRHVLNNLKITDLPKCIDLKINEVNLLKEDVLLEFLNIT